MVNVLFSLALLYFNIYGKSHPKLPYPDILLFLIPEISYPTHNYNFLATYQLSSVTNPFTPLMHHIFNPARPGPEEKMGAIRLAKAGPEWLTVKRIHYPLRISSK